MMVVTHEMGFASKVRAPGDLHGQGAEIVEDAFKTDFFFGSPRSDRAQKVFCRRFLSH